MSDSDNFLIEDFPMNQVEFEKRFNTEQACMDYLFIMNERGLAN